MSTTAHSIVQLAFDPDPKAHHCGYCNSNGSCSVGVIASTMLVDDYQILMDRGWRKCGKYYYKALMKKTCCPLYTIRCDANNLQLTPAQRRVIQIMNQYINDGLKPGDHSVLTDSATTNSTACKNSKANHFRSTSRTIQTTAHPTSRDMFNAEQWLNDGKSTNARQLLRHIIEKDTPPSDELVARLRARQRRWQKKLMRLKGKNQLSARTEIHQLIKRYDRMDESCGHYNLEELLKFRETSKNKFELRLVRSYPPSEEFKRTLKMSHEVYQRYQMAIHGDSQLECSLSQFERFLCQSSLKEQSPRLSSAQYPVCGYGSFHLQYYLNEKLIACSVIDILPGGVSSVYFYYEPDLGFLKLGVYSALRELELTRRLAREIPEIKHYYLGFYVHSCVKMRYKGQYKPSFLLCPETNTWHPIEKCRPLLDANKYARFESDPNKVDEEQENNIENLKLQIQRRIMSPTELRRLNEDYFFYILERFSVFANFVGRICANRIIIALN